MRLDGIGRVHVHLFHEATGFVCPDWQKREIDGTAPFAHLAEVRRVTAVACEEDPAAGRLHDETAPECAVAIERRTR
jgi:hypothetical protein